MSSFGRAFYKFLGIILLLALVISNVWWYVSYQQTKDKLDAANAKVAVLTKATPKPSATPSPTATPKGTISGNVGFPAGAAPAQTVCAVSTSDATKKVCVDHPEGDLAYQIAVPAGSYTVYATLNAPQGDYKTTYKAYYNKFVTCGAQSNCAPGLHSQNEVVNVAPGATVTGVNPTDWYALGITQ